MNDCVSTKAIESADVQVCVRCFQAPGVFFMHEINMHTGCKVAEKLYLKRSSGIG